MRAKILVIDDDVAFLERMQDLLLDRYDVAVAEDVLFATDLLLDHDFDLLILADELPVMTGPQFLVELSNSGRFARVPILMVSAQPHGWGQSARAPHRGFLAKPSRREQVFAAIQRLLSAEPQLMRTE